MPIPNVPLLEQALTHRSIKGPNNERLEFLGDAVLELIVTNYLLEKFPSHSEGDLSKMRANLVSRDHLAKVARKLRIPILLRTNPTGLVNNSSLLEDAVEAIVGAAYAHGGLALAQEFVHQNIISEDVAVATQDYKSLLQEKLQALGYKPPEYRIEKIVGPSHNQEFTVYVRMPSNSGGSLSVPGIGASRKQAEQEAAKKALEQL